MNGRHFYIGLSCTVGLIVGTFLLVSCRPRPIMHAYQPIPGQAWSRTDTLRFDLPYMPDAAESQVSVGVRCTNQLDYQDLWLVVEQRTALVRRDTVHFIMANLNGQWLSMNPFLHADELAAGTVSLTTPESQLLVYHVMQPFTVTGISEVGIKVEPVSAFHTVASRVDTQQNEQQ